MANISLATGKIIIKALNKKVLDNVIKDLEILKNEPYATEIETISYIDDKNAILTFQAEGRYTYYENINAIFNIARIKRKNRNPITYAILEFDYIDWQAEDDYEGHINVVIEVSHDKVKELSYTSEDL